MDILTLELFDVTVSEALREIQRALEDHPTLPLRIVLGGDEMLQHNILRFLERQGRPSQLRSEGGRHRIEVGAPPARPVLQGRPEPTRATPAPAPQPSAVPAQAGLRPLLITRSCLGQGSAAVGRRVLLGVLRELEPGVPWICLALEGLDLLEDPLALRLLQDLQDRGVAVRISRESQLFPLETGAFEVMEDSHWQRLVGRGAITIL